MQNGRDERRVGPGGGVLHAIHLLQLVGAVCLEDSLPQDYRMVLASPTSRSFRIIALAGRLVAPATAKHSHTTLGRTRSASPTPSPSAFPYEQELGEERQALVVEHGGAEARARSSPNLQMNDSRVIDWRPGGPKPLTASHGRSQPLTATPATHGLSPPPTTTNTVTICLKFFLKQAQHRRASLEEPLEERSGFPIYLQLHLR